MWESSKQKGAALLVLLALADIANDDGVAWPGAGDEGWLTKRTRLSSRGVRKLVHETLVPSGELAVTERPGKSNLYHVLAGAEQCAGVALSSTEESKGQNNGSAEPPFRGDPEPRSGVVEKEAASPQDSPQRTRRGLVYDALLSELYPAGAELTPREKRKVGMAAVEIEKAGGGPDDVVERVRLYRRHPTYSGVACTAQAVALHWGEFAPPPAGSRMVCPECETGGGFHHDGCSLAKSPQSAAEEAA